MVRDGLWYAAALGCLGAFAAFLGGVGWGMPAWALAAFMLYFFRDPSRVIPAGDGVVSPADGRVVDLRQAARDGQNVWKMSIFLSIFDVHVNRAPIGGVIRTQFYRPGRFHIANQPKASVENEQNVVTIEGEQCSVAMKQIAGAIARRIVFDKKVGDVVARGERVGLIKFGSRVDVFFPIEYSPSVAVGRRVKAGSSVIATPPGAQRPAGEPGAGKKR